MRKKFANASSGRMERSSMAATFTAILYLSVGNWSMLTATILRHDGAIELDRTVEVWDDGDTEYFGLHTFKQLMDASSDDQA